MSWWIFGEKPMPPWDERRVLISWNGSQPWTIGDSFEGVQVFGDTGSGKSSTSARVLATAMVRAGYGGLVLAVKPEDVTDWQRTLQENGRSGDGIFFGPQEAYSFNFLRYEMAHGAKRGLGTKNATSILTELVAMAHRSGGAADQFWQQAAAVLISRTLDLINAAAEMPSMLLAKQIIESAPLFLDQARDTQWQARSCCWQRIQQGRERAKNDHDFQLAEAYWLREFPLLPEKTRQSIVATFTASVAHHFCSGQMHRLFGVNGESGAQTVTPDAISDGKIIVVNLPVLEYGAAGRFANIVWKYSTQLALQRRVNRERPVFIFADECHYFVTEHDQLFQTTARSARCATVYLTQNRSNYFAESPGEAGRHRVESMVACLKTQIIHQCSHEPTRRAFSDAIGKRRITRTNQTHQFGHGKTTHSEAEQVVDDYWLLPDAATRLRTGGEANSYEVTAFVTKAGKSFGNGRPHLLIKYDQRNFERTFWGGHTVVAIAKKPQG